MLVSDLLYSAFRAARILKSPGSGLSANDQSDGLALLNDIVDEWSARQAYSWTGTFTGYTLTPNHQPHLLGPTAAAPDFETGNVRPARIDSAAIILTDQTPATDAPLNIRDGAWWAEQRSKSVTSTVPTDLYYEPGVPNGALYLWPVPSFGYGLRLEAWVSLASFAAATAAVTAPPAYARTLKLTLAEELCVLYGVQAPPQLAMKAQRARAALQSNNLHSPRIPSADIGTAGRRRGGFNWTTGLPS